MAVTSGFFNSLNGDRRYTAEQFSALMDGLINNGVFANIGTAFSVKADTGNTVMVGVGRAWFNSAWIYNDAVLPVTLNNSEMLLDRIDAVVIEINHTESVRSGTIRIVQGTASSSPQKPTMTSLEDVHQYPLAYIYRTAGSSSINQSNIENAVGTSACPYVTGILQVQSIDNIVAQWESEFRIWMDGLEESLGDDVAVQLANRIISVESQFTTLAKEGRVYADLEDSNSDKILDSEGRVIQGSTAFAYRGSGSDGEHVSSNDLIVALSDLQEKVDQNKESFDTHVSQNNTQISSINSKITNLQTQIDNVYEVGDTLTTMRNPGSNWLLCNGAQVSRSSYPKLSELNPSSPASSPWSSKSAFTGNVYQMVALNGYYIAVGYSGATACIWYATNPTGTWTRVEVPGVNTVNALTSIVYYNGYYVATGYSNPGDPNNNTIFYSYSSSINGTWTSNTIKTYYSQTGHIQPRIAANSLGMCILYGTISSNANVNMLKFTKSGSPSGTWTSGTLAGALPPMEGRAQSTDNFYGAVGNYLFYIHNYNTGGARLYYTTSAGGTWSTVELPAPGLYTIGGYTNIYYVLLCSNGTKSAPKFIYGTTPSSFPSSRTLNNITSTCNDHMHGLLYVDGYYSAICFTTTYGINLAYSTGFASNYNSFSIISSANNTDIPRGFVYSGGYYLVMTQTGKIYYLNSGTMQLPSISVGNYVKTYIKAR